METDDPEDALLLAYVDGRLDADRRQQVEDRLQVEAELRVRLAEIMLVRAVMDLTLNDGPCEEIPRRPRQVAAGPLDDSVEAPIAEETSNASKQDRPAIRGRPASAESLDFLVKAMILRDELYADRTSWPLRTFIWGLAAGAVAFVVALACMK